MTFSDLRSEILQWLDEGSATTTSSSYLNVEAALKQAHTLRLTEDNWKFMLWPRFETFTTTSAQQYSLHQEFLRPYTFRNTSRNIWLTEVPSRVIESSGADFNQDTDVDRFCLWGRMPVMNQPSSASVVTIVSSSASDTQATKAIVVTGDTTDGVRSESITPNGTSSVAGSVSFTQIIGIAKSAEWAGTLTATTNSAAVTVLKLFSDEYTRSYQQMMFLGYPPSGETIQYRFYRKPSAFGTHDNDAPDIPPPFERILVFDSLLLMGAYDNRLDGGRMGLWGRMREDMDFQLRQSQLEGQSLGAAGRFIQERHGGMSMRMPD